MERLESAPPTSQTLARGLDVLEMVASGTVALPALADQLGLPRSTAHRLATALLERRYLTLVPREGYGLGPKLLELGSVAQEQTALLRVARRHMEKLAADSLDTVHLTICESGAVLLIERVQGHRRLLPRLRIGERAKITQCAAGRALLLHQGESAWRALFAQDCGSDCTVGADMAGPLADFLFAMREAVARGYTVAGDEPLHSVAAPVCGANGAVVAALGLSAAAQYLDGARIAAAGQAVRAAADAISADLGLIGSTSHAHVAGLAARNHARRKNLGSVRAIAGQEPASPLEAEGTCVHDHSLDGTARAGEPDLGVA